MNLENKRFREALARKVWMSIDFDAGPLLREGSLRLLMEEVTDDELQQLATQAKEARDSLQALARDMPGQGFTTSKKFMKDIAKELPTPDSVIALGLEGVGKDRLAAEISKATVAIDKITSANASIVKAFEVLRQNLGRNEIVAKAKAGTLSPEELELYNNAPFSEFIEKVEDWTLTPAQIKKGITRAYQPPQPAKGFLKKLQRWIGWETTPPDDQAMLTDFLSIPLASIIGFEPPAAVAAEMGSGRQETQQVLQDTLGAVQDDVEASIEAGESGEFEEEAVEGEDEGEEEGEGEVEEDEVEEDEVEEEEVEEEPATGGKVKLVGTMFKYKDPNDPEKGVEFRDESWKEVVQAVVDKPNTKNRRRFTSLMNAVADRELFESRQRMGSDRWMILAGLSDEQNDS